VGIRPTGTPNNRVRPTPYSLRFGAASGRDWRGGVRRYGVTLERGEFIGHCEQPVHFCEPLANFFGKEDG